MNVARRLLRVHVLVQVDDSHLNETLRPLRGFPRRPAAGPCPDPFLGLLRATHEQHRSAAEAYRHLKSLFTVKTSLLRRARTRGRCSTFAEQPKAGSLLEDPAKGAGEKQKAESVKEGRDEVTMTRGARSANEESEIAPFSFVCLRSFRFAGKCRPDT